MKIEVYLISDMTDVIGSPVILNTDTIGKIVDYNKQTGKSIIEIDSEIDSQKILDKMNNYAQISCKNTHPDSINWEILDNEHKIKFTIPIIHKKWWQFWK